MFLVPKPTENKLRLTIDFRQLNKYCKEHKLYYDTLKHLKNLTRAGDWMVSFDFTDGYYTLGILEKGIDVFTVNHRGKLFIQAGLPIGWRCCSFYLYHPTQVFYPTHAKTTLAPNSEHHPLAYESAANAIKTFVRNSRWRGFRLLPYMGDFLLCRKQRRSPLVVRTSRFTTRLPWTRVQPQERTLGTYTDL
jgi:hypothetical protein